MILQAMVALLATSILTSQTGIDLFASLMVLVLLWMGYRWREQQSSHSLFNGVGAEWIFVAWFLVILAGFAVNGFVGDNWYMKLVDLKWILIFYFLLAALRYLKPTESWIRPAAIVFGICSLYAIVMWFLGFDPIHPEDALSVMEDMTVRTGGFIAQPDVFAQVYQLPLCLFFGIWLLMIRWKEKGAWILGLVEVLGFLAVLLSFTRGVWFSMAVSLLAMTFVFSRRGASLLLVVGGFVSYLCYQFWPAFHDRIHFSLNGGDNQRFWIWKANFEIFKDHPFLGKGYGENIAVLPEYYRQMGAPVTSIVSHAHNQYLHMLAGTGILGFVIYLAMVFYFLIMAVRVYRRLSSRETYHQGLALGLIGAQVAFLVGGLTEANLEHSKMKHALIFLWALTAWLAYEHRVLRERV